MPTMSSHHMQTILGVLGITWDLVAFFMFCLRWDGLLIRGLQA
jgi:hypothetical protein